jgi:hypothetical protein
MRYLNLKLINLKICSITSLTDINQTSIMNGIFQKR